MSPTPESTGSIKFVRGDNTEVLRISKDGITVNPDVPVDEIAQTVLNLVQRAVEATILCNKVAQWMIERSYATGHGDTIEGLLEALVQSVREEERELCAQMCDEIANKPSNMVLGVALDCADAIRARGEK